MIGRHVKLRVFQVVRQVLLLHIAAVIMRIFVSRYFLLLVIDPAPPKALSTYDVIYDDKKSKYIFHFAPSDKYSVVENGVDLGAVNAFPIKPDENREFFVKYEESRKILAIKNTI